MEGDRAAASDRGGSQVIGEPLGEKTRDWYALTNTGDAQVGG